MEIDTLPLSSPPIIPNKEDDDAKSWSSWSPKNTDLAAPVEKERKSYDLFSVSSSNGEDSVGAGLRNIANTCYLNSVLQCIMHTVPMVEKLRSSDHQHTDSDGESDFCCICALLNLSDVCIAKSGWFVSPLDFTGNLNKISPDFLLGQQEDAHEFLLCLLDSLHNSCLEPSFKGQPSSMDKDSLVKHVYGGCSISQLQCSECGHCSDTPEPLLDLSLEITDADTLIDALKSFTKVEKIEEKLTCDGCKAQVLMEKQTKIDQAPLVVSLHLKRFRNDGLFTTKIDNFVEYPLELDLRPFISCPKDEDETMYELYAILVHQGGASFGHYYCCIRSSPTTWHIMDDSMVSGVSETDVLKERAYILFYLKKGSSPWFCRIMEEVRKMKDSSPKSVLDHNDSSSSPSSAVETSSSSSRGTTEKDEEPEEPVTNGEKDEEPVADQQEQSHSPSTSHTCNEISHHNVPHCTVMSRRVYAQPVRPLKSEQMAVNIDNVFHDVPLENEEEDTLIPLQVNAKSNKVEKKTAIEPRKDACRVNAPLKRLVKGMPASRRAQFMACMLPEEKEKSPHTSKSEPLKKRTREFSNSSISEGKKSCQKRSSGNLRPLPVIRGLFSQE